MSMLDEFIERGARYMASDRPDIYDYNRATERLRSWIDTLSNSEFDSIGSGGFILMKAADEEYGSIEYSLVRQVIDFSDFSDGDKDIFDWVGNSRGFKN